MIKEQYARLENNLNNIFPKKEKIYKMKLKDNGKTELYILNRKIILFVINK